MLCLVTHECCTHFVMDVSCAVCFALVSEPHAERAGEAEQSVLEDGHFDAVRDGSSGLFRLDEAGLAEDGEVSRHGWLGDIELVGEFTCGHWSVPEEFEDATACRVGECLEDGGHIRYLANNRNECKGEFEVSRNFLRVGLGSAAALCPDQWVYGAQKEARASGAASPRGRALPSSDIQTHGVVAHRGPIRERRGGGFGDSRPARRALGLEADSRGPRATASEARSG